MVERDKKDRASMPLPHTPVVLVVEDDGDTRLMLALWFQQCGCRVVEAANAVDALLRVSECRPDAIITDMALRGSMDGLEFCRLVRQDPATRTIPLIAATGWAHPEAIEQARQAGCDHVFIKPYAPDALSDEVLRAVAAQTAPHGDS